MIGTHDSFTYLRARRRVMELFSGIWRTQRMTLAEQRAAGVGYVDVRVRRVLTRGALKGSHATGDFALKCSHTAATATAAEAGTTKVFSRNGTAGAWRLCHGLVDLDMERGSLGALLDELAGLRVRLILERGDSLEFEVLIPRLRERYPNLSFACIKKGWRVLLDRDMPIVDYTFTPWLSGLSFRQNICRLFDMIRRGEPMGIRRWARRYNPEITGELRTDKRVHFVDML